MKIIVVGHGMVGHKFLECLADAGAQDLEVTVLCEEPRPAYDRVHLSEFFAGKSAEDLSLVPGFFDQHNNMLLRLNAKATAIDRREDGHHLHRRDAGYDKLVLATGSYPFVPPLPGKERKDCFVYRTIEDLEAMLECGQREVGRGDRRRPAGPGMRQGPARHGLETHVVEFAPRLMAVQVDDGGGRVLRQKIEELGVTAHTGKNTVEIVDGAEGTHRMNFADGTHLDTDMIVFSAGIRPRDELARASGLTVGARGGIVIDNNCLTSDPHVYAIGECALWTARSSAWWPGLRHGPRGRPASARRSPSSPAPT
jgi:nitrite reductase (NADH) large subunit